MSTNKKTASSVATGNKPAVSSAGIKPPGRVVSGPGHGSGLATPSAASPIEQLRGVLKLSRDVPEAAVIREAAARLAIAKE